MQLTHTKIYGTYFVTLALLVLCSCSKTSENKETIMAVNDESEVQLVNGQIDSIIEAYVNTFDVNPHNRLVALTFYRDPFRNYYYITQSQTKAIIDEMPDYFFVHNGAYIVLLFTGGENLFSRAGINEKIELAMEQLGVKLPNKRIDYNPPVWEILEECSGEFEHRQRSDFITNFLPCGYQVRQDSLRFDNFYLLKK